MSGALRSSHTGCCTQCLAPKQGDFFIDAFSERLDFNRVLKTYKQESSRSPSNQALLVLRTKIIPSCCILFQGWPLDIQGFEDYTTYTCRLKVTQAWHFLKYFFAETESLWSQGPVTQDFWKSYSIQPRYLTFKHFRVCSVSDKIISS